LEVYSAARQKKLTFVVAGGGFAGVETVAAINDFIRDSVKYYRHLSDNHVKVVLVHARDPVLPEFVPELGRYAQRKLAERQVEVITNCAVKSFANGFVELSSQAPIECDTLIWTAGVTPSPALSKLPIAKEHGHIKVNHFMQSTDHANVWAAGDCAHICDPHSGKPYPPTAQHALREGCAVAQNILSALDGKSLKTFSYQSMGQMAAIGRRTGVAMVFGLKISGFIGWLMWRTIYLAKLPGLDRQCRVGMQWLLDIVFPPDLAQYVSTRGRFVDSKTSGQPFEMHSGTHPFAAAEAEAIESRTSG
jgi:NADH dehydrogenase